MVNKACYWLHNEQVFTRPTQELCSPLHPLDNMFLFSLLLKQQEQKGVSWNIPDLEGQLT